MRCFFLAAFFWGVLDKMCETTILIGFSGIPNMMWPLSLRGNARKRLRTSRCTGHWRVAVTNASSTKSASPEDQKKNSTIDSVTSFWENDVRRNAADNHQFGDNPQRFSNPTRHVQTSFLLKKDQKFNRG